MNKTIEKLVNSVVENSSVNVPIEVVENNSTYTSFHFNLRRMDNHRIVFNIQEIRTYLYGESVDYAKKRRRDNITSFEHLACHAMLHEICHAVQFSGKHADKFVTIWHRERYFKCRHDDRYVEKVADRFASKYTKRFKKFWSAIDNV